VVPASVPRVAMPQYADTFPCEPLDSDSSACASAGDLTPLPRSPPISAVRSAPGRTRRLDPSQPRHAFFDESRVFAKARSPSESGGQSAPSCVSESIAPTEADKMETSETRDLLPHGDDGKQTSVELQGRGWRDAVLFVLGSMAAFLVLLASGHQPRPPYMTNDKLPVLEIGYSLAEPDGLILGPCSEAAAQLDTQLNDTWLGSEGDLSERPVVPAMAEVLDPPGPNWHISSNQVSPYAYVLMAYDEPGRPAEHIWRAVAMVRALQRLSQYPVLLLTNTTHLPDGTSVADTFWKLNTQVLPVHSIQLPDPLKHLVEQHLVESLWRISFWKLQIWRLTQYEKLIWLDIDGVCSSSGTLWRECQGGRLQEHRSLVPAEACVGAEGRIGLLHE